MATIGIFFGTDSGTTRLLAKKMAKILGDDIASKPLNINRTSVEDFLAYDALILGTPTYGEGCLPGIATGVKDGSWQEFLPKLGGCDLSGKTIALYGLGNSEKYTDRFADALFELHSALAAQGASFVGQCNPSDYSFEQSQAVVAGEFVGLVLDHVTQPLLTDTRIQNWLDVITPQLLAKA
jgi:flavodoxin I